MMRKYLLRVIAAIIGTEDDYELIDTFASETKYLRSYIFLESEKRVVFIEFTKRPEIIVNYDIFQYLKITSGKEVKMILFNCFAGENYQEDDIYHVFQNKANPDGIKLFLSQNYKEQIKHDTDGVVDFLYNQAAEFYDKYLSEIAKEENISNLFDI